MICLDTNAVIALLAGSGSPVRRRFEETIDTGETIAISTLVAFELRYGAAKSKRREGNDRKVDVFLASPVHVIDFDRDDAQEAGGIRASLEAEGTPIGPYDVLIAAQARRRSATLVTANTREFARVPGLQVEDWSAA